MKPSFTLKTFLLLIAIICVAVAHWERSTRFDRAIATLKKWGASVGNESVGSLSDDLRWNDGPFDEWTVFFNEPVSRVEIESLLGCLALFPRLEVGAIGIDEEAILALQSLQNLKVLTIIKSRIDSRDMIAISKIVNLQVVIIASEQIDAKGIQHLADLPNLEKLAIRSPGIVDADVEVIRRRNRKLRVLKINADYYRVYVD